MNKCTKCSARHTTNANIQWYTQTSFLNHALCTYECCLCKSEHRIKWYIFFKENLEPLVSNRFAFEEHDDAYKYI